MFIYEIQNWGIIGWSVVRNGNSDLTNASTLTCE